MKKAVVLLSVVVMAVAAQSVLADGRGHHHGGRGSGWLPFAAGAVIGGIAIGAMMQPQPVYAQPVYVMPPQPRVVMPRPYYVPVPIYSAPAPQLGYYYERD